MFTPKAFEKTDFTAIQQLMTEYPLATLICSNNEGIESCHAPLYWQDDGSKFGALYGHIAKKNPFYQGIDSSSETSNHKWLVIFQDTGHYISPNWYPSKHITHKEVPTWNYRSVHLTVSPVIITERSELKNMVATLSAIHEASQPRPWSLDDAPEDYIDAMCRAIVGFKLNIISYQAQFKLSQNKTDDNKASVVKALRGLGSASAIKMAAHIESPP